MRPDHSGFSPQPHFSILKNERTIVNLSPELIVDTAWNDLGDISNAKAVLCNGRKELDTFPGALSEKIIKTPPFASTQPLFS
jgi:hypothetical protein